jgi:hypothetical protein
MKVRKAAPTNHPQSHERAHVCRALGATIIERGFFHGNAAPQILARRGSVFPSPLLVVTAKCTRVGADIVIGIITLTARVTSRLITTIAAEPGQRY